MRNTLAAAFALALLALLALAASCGSSSPPPAQPQRAAADPADAEGDRETVDRVRSDHGVSLPY